MGGKLDFDRKADEMVAKILAAKQRANDAGQDVGEEFVKGVVQGVEKRSKEAKSEIAKIFEDFNKTTNNFKSRKSITNAEWTRVLGLSKELIKSERYADSVREKLSDISVILKNGTKVSGLEKVLEEWSKVGGLVESVQWAEAGKNYRKRPSVKQQKVVDATATKSETPKDIASRISRNSSIKGIKDIKAEAVSVAKALDGMYDAGIRDTEEYITLQYKLLKIFDKMSDSFGGVKGSGAKDLVELRGFIVDNIQQATGTNLFDMTVIEDLFGGSDFSLFNKSLSGLGMKDVADLLYMQKYGVDAMDKLKESTELATAATETHTDALREQEKVAESAAQTQEKLQKTQQRTVLSNEEINHALDVKAKYTGANLQGKSDFINAIKYEWEKGNKAVSAKLFEQYKTRFSDGTYDPSADKKFGSDWSKNYNTYLEQANRHLAEMDNRLEGITVGVIESQGEFKKLTDIVAESRDAALVGVDLSHSKFYSNGKYDFTDAHISDAEAQLEAARQKAQGLKEEAMAAKEAFDEVSQIRAQYAGKYSGKSDLQAAIKEEWSKGNKAVAAKLYEQYQTRFPKGLFDPSKQKMFGDDWINNHEKYLEQANRHIVELDTILNGMATDYGKYEAYSTLDSFVKDKTKMLDNLKQNKLVGEVVKSDLDSRREVAKNKYATDDAAVAQENLNQALEEFTRRNVVAKNLLEQRNKMIQALEDDGDMSGNDMFTWYETPAKAINEASRKFSDANLESYRFAAIDLKEAVRVAKELGVEVNETALGLDEIENTLVNDMLMRQKKFAMDNDKAGTPEKSKQIWDAAIAQQNEYQQELAETAQAVEKVGAVEKKQSDYYEMSHKEATDYIFANYDKDLWDRWFLRGEDDARSEIAKKLESDAKLKNAALNQMWHNYKSQTESDISYEDFLNSKIPVYKGERAIGLTGELAESITKDAASFSLDKRIAKDFAGALDSRIGAVLETYISPKDTLGMPRPKYDTESNAEAEVLIPMSRVADSSEYLKFKQKLKEKQDMHSSGETSEDVAKTIASYEELCGVVTRYNELVKKDIHRTTDEDFEFNDLLNRISSSTENVPLLKLREALNKDGGYDVDKLAGLIDFDKIIAQQKQKDAGQQLQEFIKLSKDVLPEEMSIDQQTAFANILNKIQAEGMSAADAIKELSNELKTLNGQQDVLEEISDTSPNNKFREYDDSVAVGYDRIQKLQKIRDSGTVGTYSTSSLLRAGYGVWDEVKNNNFFSDIPEENAQRLSAIDNVVTSVVNNILREANLTEEQVVQQLLNIRNATGGNFKSNGNDMGWSHFATYDNDGNKHKMQKEDGVTYKVYAAFENIEDLNSDIVSSIMSELTKAGFEGRLKTTTGSTSLIDRTGMIANTDQLVVHGASKKDQEIAYNVLRNMKTPLSYLGGGIDTPDGSFTQTLASDSIEKYIRVQSEASAEIQKLEEHVNNLGEEFKNSEQYRANFDSLVEGIKSGSVTASQAMERMSDAYEEWSNSLVGTSAEEAKAPLGITVDRTNPLVNNAFKGMNIKDWIAKNVQPNARGQLEEELYKLAQSIADGGESYDAQVSNIADFIVDNYKAREKKEANAYEDVFKELVVVFDDADVAAMGPQLFEKAKAILGRRLQKRTEKNKNFDGIDQLVSSIASNHPGLFTDPDGNESQYNKLDELLDHYAKWKPDSKRKTIDRTLSDADKPNIIDDINANIVPQMYQNMLDSAAKLEEEQLAFDGVAESADKAAKAKEKFDKANKNVQQGADESSDSLDDEAESLEGVNRAAANLPDVSAYDSTTVRYDANGNPYSVSGTSRQEMIDGTHVRSTDNYQFDAENNRWDYMGTVQSSERTREMVQALEEYYRILNQIQKLRLDPSNAIHTEEVNKLETDDLLRAYQRVVDLGIQVNDIENQVNLSVSQRQALLDVELRARQEMYDVIAKMEDKQATTATKPFQKTVADEIKKAANIDTNVRLLGDDGASDRLQAQIAEYRRLVDELVDMRLQLARNSDLTNNVDFSNRFADTAKRAENARVAIEGVFKESKKLQKLGTLITTGSKDVSNVQNLKSEMIEFANSALDGEVKVNGFNKEGNQMYITLTKASGAVEDIAIALHGATGHLQAFSTETSYITNEWEEFKTEAVDGAKNILEMYVGFQEGVQALSTGIEYVKEIDLAMTELKKVTDETDASYKEFLKDAGSTAAIIGSTISDFTEASATFARLGYSLEESSSMAETAIIYKNVADGLDTVEESSESIISTMMAFGIEANDTMSIIDRFNEVGNRFAITSSGIGEALQRSASALFSAGNTIDESVALITAANSVVNCVPRCYSNIATSR